MSHYIGLADQYASFDNSITPFNFLNYSEKKWKWYNNPIIPQSRLRISDYRGIFKECGWDIVEERNSLGSIDDLRSIQIAPEFRKYKEEDLLVIYSWIVTRPI